MSRTERREYVVGVLAAAVLSLILVLTALGNRRHIDTSDGIFYLTAEFDRADGIHEGSVVRVAGVNVGTVVRPKLDERNRALLTLRFDQPLVLPEDTAAVVETDGVFGAKHIELRLGGTQETLRSGGRISYTQPSVIIEDLIARIVNEAKATRGQSKSKPQS